jgi:hypothetical protein
MERLKNYSVARVVVMLIRLAIGLRLLVGVTERFGRMLSRLCAFELSRGNSMH